MTRTDASTPLGSPSGLTSQRAGIRTPSYLPNDSTHQLSQQVDRRTGAAHSFNDDGDAVSDYGNADDTSTACPPDPEAGAEGQFCAGDDAENPMATRAANEPALGQDRDLLLADPLNLPLVPDARASTPPSLRPRGNGWGISDDNLLAGTRRSDAAAPNGAWANMFEDPRFKDLKVQSVRRIVPWDIVARGTTPRTTEMSYRCSSSTVPRGVTQRKLFGDETSDVNGNGAVEENERSTLDQATEWLDAARNARLEVLVSFQHTRDGDWYCYLPTRAEYRAAIRQFRDRFPWVTLYTAWNEPNHKTQPTNRRFRPDGSGARQAGRYYLDLKQECKRSSLTLSKCVVAAGDFLDDDTFTNRRYNSAPGNAFFKQYVAGLNGQEPTVWAWHPYSAGYRGQAPDRTRPGRRRSAERSSLRLQRFLDATRSRSTGRSDPRLWLTEFGGRYDQHRDPDFDGFGPAAAEQAANADLTYLLDLPFKDFAQNRITRAFVYQWVGGGECAAPCPAATDPFPFDSGLLDVNSPDRRARSLYNTLKAKTNP